jgi:hypothetical protein
MTDHRQMLLDRYRPVTLGAVTRPDTRPAAREPDYESEPPRSKWLIVALIAGILLLIASGIGAYVFTRPDSDPLARTDPAGAAVCRNLRSWINGDVKDKDGKPLDSLMASMLAAQQAEHSTTAGIRATVSDLMDDPAVGLLKAYGGPSEFRIANLPQLHAACVAAGESMPAYVEP